MRKKGRLTGYLMGLNMISRMNEVAALVALQRVIESEEYRSEGYEDVRDFCKDVAGCSYETINRRLGDLKKVGAEVASILSTMGLTMKDIRSIEYALITDEKTGKKALKIDDGRTIPFEEDRKDELQTAIDLIREQRDSAKKEAKHAASKVDGIDKEHKKEVKAMQKEIEDLKAQVISPETPEEFDEVFRLIERKVNEIVIASKRLKFDEAHKDVAEGPIKGKYKMRINTLETQFTNLVDSLNEAILG